MLRLPLTPGLLKTIAQSIAGRSVITAVVTAMTALFLTATIVQSVSADSAVQKSVTKENIIKNTAQKNTGQKTIIWLKSNVPTSTITNGKHKNQGTGDLTANMIIEQLNQYQHTWTNTNYPRIFTFLAQKENYCASGIIPTPERKKYAYFSLPQILIPPHRLITTRENLHLFQKIQQHQNTESMSLAYLLKHHPELTMGLVVGRSYGKQIDTLTERYHYAHNIVKRTGQDPTTGILRMLAAGRIDYTIEYAPMLEYFSDDNPQFPSLVSLPINEANDYVLASIACSKNAFGKQAIEKINHAIKKLRNSARYREVQEHWLDDRNVAGFRKIYNEKFLHTY